MNHSFYNWKTPRAWKLLIHAHDQQGPACLLHAWSIIWNRMIFVHNSDCSKYILICQYACCDDLRWICLEKLHVANFAMNLLSLCEIQKTPQIKSHLSSDNGLVLSDNKPLPEPSLLPGLWYMLDLIIYNNYKTELAHIIFADWWVDHREHWPDLIWLEVDIYSHHTHLRICLFSWPSCSTTFLWALSFSCVWCTPDVPTDMGTEHRHNQLAALPDRHCQGLLASGSSKPHADPQGQQLQLKLPCEKLRSNVIYSILIKFGKSGGPAGVTKFIQVLSNMWSMIGNVSVMVHMTCRNCWTISSPMCGQLSTQDWASSR